MTLIQRAARYFGYDDMPRTSIRINNERCLIVAENPQCDTILMYYSEEFGRGRGDFIRLTDRALHELIEALECHYVAPEGTP